MPKRNDIEKVLIIGPGPSVIGQGAEYDYILTEALRALKDLIIETVIVNPNPSTVCTDEGLADSVYMEPLDIKYLAAIIMKESPSAIIATFGGQKALNLCQELTRAGILENYDVKLIGAGADAIELTENRTAFKRFIGELNLDTARSASASNEEEAEGIAKHLRYPVVVRPTFTTGGYGGGLVYNVEELRAVAARGISKSLIKSVLVEEAVLGLSEIEAEVLKDNKGNVIVAGIIENIDPMGVHTGDSVSVIPPLTLSKDIIDRIKEKAQLIASSIKFTGSMNVQFAYSKQADRLIVVEVNLRATRSTALLSRATGLNIANISSRLIMGICLDEISYEGVTLEGYDYNPQYVTVKMPYWDNDKFSSEVLGTQMKSVGEVMAIGKDFKEAFGKALNCFNTIKETEGDLESLYNMLRCPTSNRYDIILKALELNGSTLTISTLCGIDKYYLDELKDYSALCLKIKGNKSLLNDESLLKKAKQYGMSDIYLSYLSGIYEKEIMDYRLKHAIMPKYDKIPYSGAFYSTYLGSISALVKEDVNKIIILGSGYNRIGQGMEFDYNVFHAAKEVSRLGYKAIVINSNPASITLDTEVMDKVYIEPLTAESVHNIALFEGAEGVIASFGGQASYSMINALSNLGHKIIGSDRDMISLTEDKQALKQLLNEHNIMMPNSYAVKTVQEALLAAKKIQYPIIVRPYLSTGGKGMQIIHEDEGLISYMAKLGGDTINIEQFLTDAVEVEADVVYNGRQVYAPQFMEHIEYAGIHSGDSDCVIPVSDRLDSAKLYGVTEVIVKLLNVKGLINIKYAVYKGNIYLMEVRLRCSRSVPLMSKVLGKDLIALGIKSILSDADLPLDIPHKLNYYAVKCAVFPFEMFSDVDPALGPEMRSIGSVIGISSSMGDAYYKAQAAAGCPIPMRGSILISVDDTKKKELVPVAKELNRLSFKILATEGTYKYLLAEGIACEKIDKVCEGRPNCADAMINGEVSLLINTPSGRKSEYDDSFIRKVAIKHRISYITTIEAAAAVINGIKDIKSGSYSIRPINMYHRENGKG